MRSTPVCALVPVKWPATVTVWPLKLTTRPPLLVPVLLSERIEPDERCARGLDHDTIGRPAARRVDRFVDRVAPVGKPEDVGVVAEAAVERVVARAADQHVVAGKPVQRVVAGQAQHQVVAGRAVERVVAGCADDDAERGVGELQPARCCAACRSRRSDPAATSVTVSMPSAGRSRRRSSPARPDTRPCRCRPRWCRS